MPRAALRLHSRHLWLRVRRLRVRRLGARRLGARRLRGCKLVARRLRGSRRQGPRPSSRWVRSRRVPSRMVRGRRLRRRRLPPRLCGRRGQRELRLRWCSVLLLSSLKRSVRSLRLLLVPVPLTSAPMPIRAQPGRRRSLLSTGRRVRARTPRFFLGAVRAHRRGVRVSRRGRPPPGSPRTRRSPTGRPPRSSRLSQQRPYRLKRGLHPRPAQRPERRSAHRVGRGKHGCGCPGWIRGR
jgi:hypothetical protein